MRPVNTLYKFLGPTLLVTAASMALAEEPTDTPTQPATEKSSLMVGTTTIKANEEEPMTTVIMPWKDSAPVEIDDKPIQLVTEELLPIDPEVFRRQFQYYNSPP